MPESGGICMSKNTGLKFEDEVYEIAKRLVESNDFLISNPNVKVCKKKSYYSKDRDSDIICDVTVEKYLGNPDENCELIPAIIVVIECKDYSGSIPVDDVEEFHAKLQQIGADNTKGIMITRNAEFQRGALNYAKSKHIALARILPDDQIHYIMHMLTANSFSDFVNPMKRIQKIINALTDRNFISNGEKFFSLTGDMSLEDLIGSMLK